MNISVNILKKGPVRHQWELWMEIIDGTHLVKRLKCYCDDEIGGELMRGNQYAITVDQVFRDHILITESFKCITLGKEKDE